MTIPVKGINFICQKMVPELEKLERYISGDMESSEKEALELVLRDDPMLADAIDGLKGVESREVLRSSLARLYRGNKNLLSTRNKKRDQLSKRKSRVSIVDNQYLFMGIAAGLVILIVSVFVIRQMNKSVVPGLDPAIAHHESEHVIIPTSPVDIDSSSTEEEEVETPVQEAQLDESSLIAAHVETKPGASSSMNETTSINTRTKEVAGSVASSPEEETDDLLSEVVEEEKPELTSFPPKASKPVSISAREEKAAVITSPSTPVLLDETAIEKEEKAEPLVKKRYKDPLPPVYDTIKIGANAGVPPVISREDSANINYYEKGSDQGEFNRNNGKLLKAQALSDLMYQGVQALRKEEYEVAREKFKEVIASSAKNVTAYYYLGLTEMAAENYKASIRYFRRNLNYPAAPIYEENKWNLSRAYLKAGKINPAKRLLEEIVNSNSPFKADALTQLKDLE